VLRLDHAAQKWLGTDERSNPDFRFHCRYRPARCTEKCTEGSTLPTPTKRILEVIRVTQPRRYHPVFQAPFINGEPRRITHPDNLQAGGPRFEPATAHHLNPAFSTLADFPWPLLLPLSCARTVSKYQVSDQNGFYSERKQVPRVNVKPWRIEGCMELLR
jgi:hypothetical protein